MLASCDPAWCVESDVNRKERVTCNILFTVTSVPNQMRTFSCGERRAQRTAKDCGWNLAGVEWLENQ